MVWHRSKQSVILVGLVVLAAGLGLHSMSAEASPPLQVPYPAPCPCTLVLVAADSAPSPASCVPITCQVTDGAGLPAAGVECNMSVLSQPGAGASLAPASAIIDENGEAQTQLCVGSTPGSVVVQGATECCQGQVKLTVQVPPLAETLTPVALPSTGSGTSGGSSWAIPLIAICSAMALAAGAVLVWRTGAARSQSS